MLYLRTPGQVVGWISLLEIGSRPKTAPGSELEPVCASTIKTGLPEARQRLMDKVADNLAAWLAGKPINVVS